MPDDSASFTQPGPTDTQSFTADPRAAVVSFYTTELAKSGISAETAAQLAEKTFSSVQTAAYIASHAHQDQPGLPREQWHPEDVKAFKNLVSERLFEHVFQEQVVDPASANNVLAASNRYDYENLYNQVRQIPYTPPVDQPDPYIQYLFENGSAQFKDTAGKFALKKFFSTDTGQKVAATATKTLEKTIGKEAAKKLLTQLGVKAATTAATGAGGAAAGAEAGAAAGAPGGPLAIVTAIVGAVVGFVIGAVVGNWSKVKHEAQEGILALSAGIYTIGSSIFTGGVAAIGAIFAAIGTVAVESATSIVVIVLAIPIVLAFMLYIITNSAYIVPPSSTVFVPGGPGGGGFQNRSSCPLVDGYIGTGSYDSQAETGHGSNPYWGSATSACSLHVPADGRSCGPSVDVNNDNYCSSKTNWDNQTCNVSDPNDVKTAFYGYAIDVYRRSGSTAYAQVSFPLLNGKITTWSYVREIGMPSDGSRGKAYLYTTTDPDTGTRYDVAFIHLVQLSSPPTGLSSGQVLGSVYPATVFRPHVHLEVQVDGVYAKPENYFCGGGSSPPITTDPLAQKIGLLILAAIPNDGTALSSSRITQLQQFNFGGIILLPGNINNSSPGHQQLKDLTSQIRQALGSNTLVAVDNEGGQVNWITLGMPADTAQKSITSASQALAVGKDRSSKLKPLGINFIMSPVMEIVRDPNSYIATARSGRAFLDPGQNTGSASTVTSYSQSMINGYSQGSVVFSAKHYPGGLGRAGVDPHVGLPTVNISRAEMMNDIQPYSSLGNSLPSIMVTHLFYPQIDSTNPSSLSPEFLTNILRNQLGYNGVILLDDLTMGALGSRTAAQRAVQAIQAGADMLIVKTQDYQTGAINGLVQAVKSGQIPESRIDASISRINSLKSRI